MSACRLTDGLSNAIYIGADGCKQGRWIAALADQRMRCELALFDDLPSLVRACPAATRILLDVPIGLCDGRRVCDMEAKAVLSRHNSRVFLAPTRSAVAAATWADANRINREVAGSGLSKQAWAIVPRIRATDECLRADAAARGVIRECHPEICFWALAGRPIVAKKKSVEGQQERLAILARFIPDAEALLADALGRWRRSQLAADDVIDALVTVVTAAAPARDLGTMPARPPRDACGLPMEMVYRRVAGVTPDR